MFQFRRFPTYTYLIQCTLLWYCHSGFPHSEISGSMLICSSPKLIAAYHVLHRLLMPRHSPCALCSLTYSVKNFQSFAFNITKNISWLTSQYILKLYYIIHMQFSKNKLVGLNGLEPSTSRLSGVRSNQLSYRPMKTSQN